MGPPDDVNHVHPRATAGPRSRSKVFAGGVLASIALVIAIGLGALGAAIAQPDVNGAWSISAQFFGQLTLYVIASMLMGVGFGVALLSSQ